MTIDHKAEALATLQGGDSRNDPHGFALVHAVLYLADKQAVTNTLLQYLVFTQVAKLSEDEAQTINDALDKMEAAKNGS